MPGHGGVRHGWVKRGSVGPGMGDVQVEREEVVMDMSKLDSKNFPAQGAKPIDIVTGKPYEPPVEEPAFVDPYNYDAPVKRILATLVMVAIGVFAWIIIAAREQNANRLWVPSVQGVVIHDERQADAPSKPVETNTKTQDQWRREYEERREADPSYSYTPRSDGVDCIDLSLMIKARNPELNFIERTAIVSNAEAKGICSGHDLRMD